MQLRHLKGKDLKMLEDALSMMKRPLSILNVSFVGGNWFIHYVLHGRTQPDALPLGVFNSNFQSIEDNPLSKKD